MYFYGVNDLGDHPVGEAEYEANLQQVIDKIHESAPASQISVAKVQLHDPNCICPRAIRSLGRLYGISMGKGWVRLDTDPKCPVHGKET